MRTERLTESQVSTLTLTEDEADRLRKLGRDLASSKNWWGSEHEDQTRQRAVIRCERIEPSRYEVRVVDAIGAVGLGDLQLLVEPKIPITHLTYILNESGQLPLSRDQGSLWRREHSQKESISVHDTAAASVPRRDDGHRR